MDIMNFTRLPFFVTVCRDVKFITVGMLQDRRKGTILRSIKQAINLQKGKGHIIDEIDFSEWNNPVHTILDHNAFEALREDVEGCGTRVNITAKGEHVPEVEQQKRVIKERARAIVQMLPYRNMPRKMRIGLIYYIVYRLNNISQDGQDFSPRDLIFGEQKLNCNMICKIPFGACAQVHDDFDITNTMESRTNGAINLVPT